MALYPPAAVCRQLYNIHKWLRLAWHARPGKYEAGTENPGDFALIQLYHISNAGTAENPNTYLLHWDEFGHGRGPIFNKNGGTAPDWDPLFRRPIYVANLDELGIDKRKVFSGEFLADVRYWLRPFRARAEENVNELNGQMRRKIDDMAREQTDYLWSLANNSDADRIVMPYEDTREAMAEWEAQRERNKQLENYYRPAGL